MSLALTAGCAEASGKLAPFVDRNRCEGKADCVRVCPYGVFQIRKLAPEDRSALSSIGRLKAWVHGWKQSHVGRLCLLANRPTRDLLH